MLYSKWTNKRRTCLFHLGMWSSMFFSYYGHFIQTKSFADVPIKKSKREQVSLEVGVWNPELFLFIHYFSKGLLEPLTPGFTILISENSLGSTWEVLHRTQGGEENVSSICSSGWQLTYGFQGLPTQTKAPWLTGRLSYAQFPPWDTQTLLVSPRASKIRCL